MVSAPGISSVNQGEISENSESKTGNKMSPHRSHFSKPMKEKDSPNGKEHKIESLDDISEKDSVGLPNNSSNAFSDLSKSHEIENGGSCDFKEIRKKPNLHIFTQNPEAIATFQTLRKKTDQKSNLKYSFKFLII